MVHPDGRYFCYADGTPFFWLADTGWLLPERLDRDEAAGYLQRAADAGFNVVQIQTINAVPAFNAYGQSSHPYGWDFSKIDSLGYGYWQHLDYIVEEAAKRNIYIGMVCIWGGLVKGGKMDLQQAKAYGEFLADRYGGRPNIVWIIGGDIKGDVRPEVWEALASSIRAIDDSHLMTFHPFGRTSSDRWWHNAPWLDFNMFQSGHRAYDQIRGDGDDTAAAAQAEDNWRYVEHALSLSPRKPVIDGEPSYEDIPHGLHDVTLPRWTAADARRYAYWSVFAGAAGHTYGHNSVMQMYKPGYTPAYGASTAWYEAQDAPGYNQMRHLRRLIEAFPFYSRIPDQSVIAGDNGSRYDRAIAARGDDFLLVYTYSGKPISVDISSISGPSKIAWWYSPVTGSVDLIGEFPDGVYEFDPSNMQSDDSDRVLIVCDAAKNYVDALK